jgi:hypothetical protein
MVQVYMRGLMKNLKQVLEYLNTVPNINAGGCGVSALAVLRWARANDEELLDDAILTGLYNFSGAYNANCKVIRDEKGVAQVPSHFAWCFNHDYYDSNGVMKISRFPYVQHIPLKHAEEFLLNALNSANNGWNNDFSRNLHIEDIEANLGINLSDVELRI